MLISKRFYEGVWRMVPAIGSLTPDPDPNPNPDPDPDPDPDLTCDRNRRHMFVN